MKKEDKARILDFILENVEGHPKDINRLAASAFGVSRATVSKYLQELVGKRLLVSRGEKKARKYQLRISIGKSFNVRLAEYPEEDVVWRQRILPLVKDVRENVRAICQSGFTEVYHNAREHSGSEAVEISLVRSPGRIWLRVADKGVGIWNRIRDGFALLDHRHALFELSKGRLTTAPEKHTGEGLFFTSRMFDEFSLWSGELNFIRRKTREGWTIEVEEKAPRPGTAVQMSISPNAKHTQGEILGRFAAATDRGFSRTRVPLQLLKYAGEELVSRSQAKRLLSRLEDFKEVSLDFRGVGTIGPAFADEIFRVYGKEHPEVRLNAVNANPETEMMIDRARPRAADGDHTLTPEAACTTLEPPRWK